MMNTIYLLLGSNMGNSREQLLIAQKNISAHIGNITASSSLYSTAAWGNTDQPDFLNQVLLVETNLTASKLLQSVLDIEKQMGRIRTIKNAPRIIDIDILFFNNEIVTLKKLTVPHPEIQNRRFVLTPLAELSPNFMHPILKKTIQQLLIACKDTLNVQKI
jgi:2-amino-4-hydroxy-6-hydroxymethyldihydropteridine diphosphokinase